MTESHIETRAIHQTVSPLVSVIIPCYNVERWLAEAIDSALAQTYRPLEIILIDDGSTDGSLAIIERYAQQHPDLIRCETGPNRGAPVARNRGLALAKGEFVKFLDADDVLLPDCLERQIAQAAQLPPQRKAIVYGDTLIADADGTPRPTKPAQPRRPNEDPIAHILSNNQLITCPLHRRQYLLAINGFDPALAKGQEYDLHLRLVLSGVEFIYHPGGLFYYRQHDAPHRIRNRVINQIEPLAHLDILHRHASRIEQMTGKPLSPAVRRVLAQDYWTHGRNNLRNGFTTEAGYYFTAARKLDARNCVSGNSPYPTLVQLFGPRWAEKIATFLRSGTSALRSLRGAAQAS